MRYDGSSNFDYGHKFGVFPSVSAGWVLTNENFMEGAKGWLDFLKLRASWGQNGNCDIDPFQYASTVANDEPYYFTNPSKPEVGAYPDILPNKDVKWETSEQPNLPMLGAHRAAITMMTKEVILPIHTSFFESVFGRAWAWS